MAVQAPVNVGKSRKARMSTINSFSNTLVITTKFDGILLPHNVREMKFSIKDLFSKYDQICSALRI